MCDSMSEDTNIEGIKKGLTERVNQSGVPLELEISSLCDRRWKHVVNQDSYFDKDEKKLREIDISVRGGPKKVGSLELECNIVIECKKEMDFAWVFYVRPFKFEVDDIEGHYIDEFELARGKIGNSDARQIILKNANLHYRNTDHIAISYDAWRFRNKAEKNEDERRREIFSAENQLKKYIEASIEQDIIECTRAIPYTIEIYLPCIVFQGLMFEAEIVNGKPTLKETDNLVLETQYRSRFSTYEESLLIDVVTPKYFEKHQKKIIQDIDSLERTLANNSRAISMKLKKAISLIAHSSKTN